MSAQPLASQSFITFVIVVRSVTGLPKPSPPPLRKLLMPKIEPRVVHVPRTFGPPESPSQRLLVVAPVVVSITRSVPKPGPPMLVQPSPQSAAASPFGGLLVAIVAGTIPDGSDGALVRCASMTSLAPSSPV